MVAPKDNSKCEQARGFYYDYLCGTAHESAPPEIFAHLRQCSFCKTEINRLKAELKETGNAVADSVKESASISITNLKLHFAYIGALVNCKTVRPFLPGLADAVLEVGVPTPITVHLDKCQQCSDDLEKIRQMKLGHRQLCRLAQLFAEEATFEEELCTEAQNAISAVGDCKLDGASVDILRHFCLCPDCREQLYKYRRNKAEKLTGSAEQSGIPCEAVSATDIFDYVVLYGLEPDKDEYKRFRSALTSHLISCPGCLGKMLQLHKTIYAIMQRAESGIVTCFKASKSAQQSISAGKEDIYTDWPIEVEIFDTSQEIGMTKPKEADAGRLVKAKAKHNARQRLSKPGIRPFIKPAAAAAAILIAALLVLQGPVVGAVELDQIYEALTRIKNVYIATFAPQKSEPVQKVWISTDLKIKMINTGLQYALWDFSNETVKTKGSDTDTIKTSGPGKDAFLQAKQTIDAPWGLLPFDNTSEVPRHAKWQRVDSQRIKTTISDTQVYDLIWTETIIGGDSVIHKKWRGYLDTKTKLPKRVERWEKLPGQEEYKLVVLIEVTYPTTAEVQADIGGAGL